MSSETHLTPSRGLGDFVEGFVPDDEPLLAARRRSEDLGCAAVSSAAGMALTFLAAARQARAVVEIGTGAGVSGLYLLRGMAADGVLTSIDFEPELHRCAKRTFIEAGFPPGRMRLIMGKALEVLPRLTSGGYDLVFADAGLLEYPSYLQQGVELLRTGGVIVFNGMLADGRMTDPSRRDTETMALREVARAVREDDRLLPLVIPAGGGLLAAAMASP